MLEVPNSGIAHLRAPIRNRLSNLMNRLTDCTVLAELLRLRWQRQAIRPSATATPVLDTKQFLALGVLRHLQGIGTLRGQVQGLLHLDPSSAETPVPLARSTWSDALGSPRRLQRLSAMIPGLVRHAETVLPDRLAGIRGLGTHAGYVHDGTYTHAAQCRFPPVPAPRWRR